MPDATPEPQTERNDPKAPAGVREAAVTTKSWLGEASLLAAIPALGYSVAFAYQAGFCDHFQIPWECIRLDAVPILLSIFGVAGSMAFFLWMFNAFTAMGSNGFEIALGESALTLGVTLPLMYAASWKGPAAVVVLIFAFNMFWRIWIAPLRQHRGLATYDEKLSAQHNEIVLNATSGGTFLANAMKGRRAWPPLVVMLSWLLTTSYLMGGRDARTRWEHFVRRGTPDLVVLRIYGDTVLAAPFDRKRWALGSETQFLKLESGVALRLENLGALRRP